MQHNEYSERPPLARPVADAWAAGVVYARPVKPPYPLRLPELSFWQAAAGLGLVVVATISAMIGGSIVGFATVPWGATEFDALVIGKWIEAAVLVATAGVLVVLFRPRWAGFGITTMPFWRGVGWTAASLGAMFGATLLSALLIAPLMLLNPELNEQTMRDRAAFAEMLPTSDTLRTVFLLIAVSIHEEILFRGLLLPLLRRVVRSWWLAITIAAIVFGSLHIMQGVLAIFQTALLAVVLSLCFLASRSLIPVIIAHFFYNLAMFQLLKVMPDLLKMAEAAQAGAEG